MSLTTPKQLIPSQKANVALDSKPGKADKEARANYRKAILTTPYHKASGLIKEISDEYTKLTGVERAGLRVDEALFFAKRDAAATNSPLVQTTVERSLLSFLFAEDEFLGRAMKLDNQTANISLAQVQGVRLPGLVAENAAWSGSGEAVFAQVELSPCRATAVENFSRQLLTQANVSELDFVENLLFTNLKKQVANQVLNGNGTNAPTGVFNITPNAAGGNNYRLSCYTGVSFAAAPNWQKTTNLLIAVEGQNVNVKNIEFLTSPTSKNILLNTQIASGFPQMIWDVTSNTIAGRPALTSTYVSTNQLLAADWSKYLLASWGLFLNNDPYKYASNFQVQITADLLYNGTPLHANAFGYSIDAV